MQLTQGALGFLIKRYSAVLKKCHILNTFGALALAGALSLGAVGVAGAAEWAGEDKTVGAGESLTVSAPVDLAGTLTINGGAVSVTTPGTIRATEVNGQASTIRMQGGTLNVNGYSEALQLKISGGTTNITGTDGNGWRQDALGGYNEVFTGGQATSANAPTTVSGQNTVVNIKSANLFGGAATNGTDGGLNIEGGATVNLLGAKDADGNHNKDFDNAGMLAAIGGSAASQILTIDGAGTTVNVAASQHGVLQGETINIDNGAAVNVGGNLLLTGYLGRTSGDGQKVSEALGSAAVGETTLQNGGRLNIASGARVSLAPNMTLVLGEAGILDNRGSLLINQNAGLTLETGSSLTMAGSLTNAGTVLVNASLDLRNSAGTLVNTGTLQVVNTTAPGERPDADQQGRVDVTKAQFDALRGGKIILGGASAANHSRLVVWTNENLRFNTTDFEGSAPSAAGKIQMGNFGSLQSGNITLAGNTLALGAASASGRIKTNILTLAPTSGTNFTLEKGRLFVTGDTTASALNVGTDGSKTLVLNGGSLRLGESEGALGGAVNGNVTVGGSNAGEFEVASGAWNMDGNLALRNEGSGNSTLDIGNTQGDDGKYLTASLTLNGDLSITKGIVTVGEAGKLTVQNLGVNTAATRTRAVTSSGLNIAAGGTVVVEDAVTVTAGTGEAMNVAGTLQAGSVSVTGTNTAVSVANGGTLNTGNLTVDGTSTVAVNGTVNATNADFQAGTTTVAQGGALTVTDTLKAAGTGSVALTNGGVLQADGSDLTGITGGAITSTAGAVVKVEGLDGETVDSALLGNLKTAFGAGNASGGNEGLLDLGKADVAFGTATDGKIAIGDVSAVGNVTSTKMKDTVVTGVDGTSGNNGSLTGAWAGVELGTGNDLNADNDLTLAGSSMNKDFILAKGETVDVAEIKVAAGKVLTLGAAGETRYGTAGAIDLTDAAGALNVTGSKDAIFTVAGITGVADDVNVNVTNAMLISTADIGATAGTADVNLSLAGTGNILADGADIFANDVKLGAGGLVSATIDGAAGGNIDVAGAISGSGTIDAKDTLDIAAQDFRPSPTGSGAGNVTLWAGKALTTDAITGGTGTLYAESGDTMSLGGAIAGGAGNMTFIAKNAITAAAITGGAGDLGMQSTEGGITLGAAIAGGAGNMTFIAKDDITATTAAITGGAGALGLESKDGDINATLQNLTAGAGGLTLLAVKGEIAAADIDGALGAVHVNAKTLDASGKLDMSEGGSLNLADGGDVTGAITLTDVSGTVGGTFTAANTTTATTINGTSAMQFSTLALGADMTVGGTTGDATTVAVNELTASGGGALDQIVEVGEGGALGYGTDLAGLNAALAKAKADGVSAPNGAYVAKATLDLGTGGGVAVGNGLTPNANDVLFGDGSALVLDQTALAGASAFTGVTDATVDTGSSLYVQNAKKGDLDIFGTASGTVDVGGWQAEGAVRTDNSMINGGISADGKLRNTVADVSKVLPGLDSELGSLVFNLFDSSRQDVNAEEKGRRFVSRLTGDGYLRTDPRAAVVTMEGAARMAVAGAVPQMTMAANNAMGNAVSQRTSLALPDGNGMQSMAADGTVSGASAGDAAGNAFAMWIMPLYQSSNGYGMKAGNFDMDYSGGLGGVAIGADYTFANAIRAGITFNIGGGYATGSGDFNETTNNMNFWGLGAYAGWAQNNFGVTADVNYTSSYNKLEQDLPSAMQMGKLKSDITAYAISAGLRGEYKFETSFLDITPHVGVRFMSLNTNEYDVTSGGDLLKGDGFSQSIWTFPIGVAFSKTVDTGNGWHVKPSLDLAVIPAAGDIMAKNDVRFTGVSGSASMETQTMDYISYMGQAGLEFGNENMSFGVNYNLQAGERSTAHGVFGTFRYEF